MKRKKWKWNVCGGKLLKNIADSFFLLRSFAHFAFVAFVIAMSDESEYDVEPEELDVYKKKYQLLLERCEVLQQVKSLLFRTKLLSML